MAMFALLSGPVLLALTLLAPLAYCTYWVLFLDELRYIPGPLFAKFSSFWLALQCRLGRRSLAVHQLHQQHGDFVRISQRHVSTILPEAIHEIYDNDRLYPKGGSYEFQGTEPSSLLTTFDIDQHAEQRRILGPAFSGQSLVNSEQRLAGYYATFAQKLLLQCSSAGKVAVDLDEWIHMLAFDLIAAFSFGKPFGLLSRGSDFLGLRRLVERHMAATNAVGILPSWFRPYLSYIPFDRFWQIGPGAILTVKGVALEAYHDRMKLGEPKTTDVLACLLSAKTDSGNAVPEDSITSQLTSLVLAGSASTAISTMHFIDKVSGDARIQKAVQAELDTVFPGQLDADWLPSDADIPKLVYTKAVLCEVLRLAPTTAAGLERTVTQKSLSIRGFAVPTGTSVSVPTYSLHRNPEIFPAPEDFAPERWLAADAAEKLRYLNVFSSGPRSCIGRDFAWMEMLKTITILFKLFSIERGVAGPRRCHEPFYFRPSNSLFRLERRVSPS